MRKDKFDKNMNKRLKYIYGFIEGDMCHVINKRKEMLDEFYSEDITSDKLLNRIRDIKAEQKVEANIIISFVVGLVASFAFWIISTIADYMNIAEEANVLFGILAFVILVAMLCLFGVGLACVIISISKHYSNKYVDHNTLYVKPYELKLIRQKLKSEHGFIWEE